jgi:uncharacterized membrane protein
MAEVNKRRHIAKTITWRMIASLDTFIITFLVTGSLKFGASIMSIEIISKMFLYYFHERAWYRVNFGVTGRHLKEVPTKFKEATVAIDFDGVIHKYSRGFQGLDNAYDDPMPGVLDALDELKSDGYRLIIVSSRPVPVIKEWLAKYNMLNYFDDVSNTKHPARYYIDDHAVRFSKNSKDEWKRILEFIRDDSNHLS